MDDRGRKDGGRVLKLPPREDQAWQIIRQIANRDDGGVFLTQHAKERMLQRHVSRVQIIHVLKSRHSVMTEGPYLNPAGDCVCKIAGYSAGQTLMLAVAIRNSARSNAQTEQLVIITVMH